jgi:ABC-2 type transport system permease protein
MLASSIASNYMLALPTVVLELLLARWVFHMEGWGDLWSIWALVTLGTVTFAAFGLIVASVTNTTQETNVINNVIWSIFLLFSGATLPLPLWPQKIQRFADFLPPTYLVTGLQRALVSAATIWEVRAELLALGAGAALAFFISVQLFRWEPEEKVTRRAKAWAAATVIPFLLLGIWESGHGRLRSNEKATLDTIKRRATGQQNR